MLANYKLHLTTYTWKKAIAAYAILMGLIFASAGYFIKSSGYSFLEIGDAYRQHFVTFTYIGKWYREIITNIVSGKFTITEYYFPHNLGMDPFVSLSYYGIGDPLTIISAFFPVKYAYFAYFLVWALRLFITGLAFLWLCHELNYSPFWSTVMAFTYATASFTFIHGSWHPIFVNGPLYLPLLILAINRIITKNKGVLLLGFVIYCSLAANFYFSFINLLTGIGYFLIRIISQTGILHTHNINHSYLHKSKKASITQFLQLVKKCFYGYSLGLLLAVIWILPILFSLSESNRVSMVGKINTDYSYKIPELLGRIIAPIPFILKTEYLPIIGITAFACISSLLSCFKIDTSQNNYSLSITGINYAPPRFWKFLIAMISVLYLFPSISNNLIPGGSGYRASYVMVLGILIAAAHSMTRIFEIKSQKAELLIIKNKLFFLSAILLSFFLSLGVYCSSLGKLLKILLTISIWTSLAFIFSLFIFNFNSNKSEFRPAKFLFWVSKNKDTTQNKDKRSLINCYQLYVVTVVILLAILPIFLSVSKYFSNSNKYHAFSNDGFKNLILDSIDMDSELQNISKSTANQTLDRLAVSSYYMQNSSLLTEIPTNTGYLSFLNRYYSQFVLDLGYAQASIPHQISGTDNRLFLDAFFSARYIRCAYFQDKHHPITLLNKYDNRLELNKAGAHLEICPKTNYAKFGLFYDAQISMSAFENMSPLEKENSLLRGIVLEENLDTINFKIKQIDVVSQINKHVTKRSTTETLVANKNQREIKVLTAELSPKQENYLVLSNINDSTEKNSGVIEVAGTEIHYWIAPQNLQWFSGQDKIVINLGQLPKGKQEIKIYSSGKTNEISAKLYQVDTSDLPQLIKEREIEQPLPFYYQDNTLKGIVAPDKSGIMVFTIPYSKGWKAEIDGHPVDIYHAQIGFMGVPLEPGIHKIELIYKTPGLRLGVIVSLITWIIFLILLHRNYAHKASTKAITWIIKLFNLEKSFNNFQI